MDAEPESPLETIARLLPLLTPRERGRLRAWLVKPGAHTPPAPGARTGEAAVKTEREDR